MALFILLPYLVFNVLLYATNGNLLFDREIGVLVPGVYGLLLLAIIYRAVRIKCLDTANRPQYLEETMLLLEVLPWEAMAVLALCRFTSLRLEMLLANLGLMVIALTKLVKVVLHTRREDEEKEEAIIQGFRTAVFEENCRKDKLRPVEVEITLLLKADLSYKEIAHKRFLSEKTVNNHVQHIYCKTGVTNKMALMNKLYR